MPAFKRILTTEFAPVLDFSQLRILYFHLKIENESDAEVEFAFGSPNDGAGIEGFVSAFKSHDFDDRPLVGVLWGRATSPAEIKIAVW